MSHPDIGSADAIIAMCGDGVRPETRAALKNWIAEAINAARAKSIAHAEEAYAARHEANAAWRRAESRARRAEVLLGYATGFVFSSALRLGCEDGLWRARWRLKGGGEPTGTGDGHLDRDAALRALNAAGLLPADVAAVIE